MPKNITFSSKLKLLIIVKTEYNVAADSGNTKTEPNHLLAAALSRQGTRTNWHHIWLFRANQLAQLNRGRLCPRRGLPQALMWQPCLSFRPSYFDDPKMILVHMGMKAMGASRPQMQKDAFLGLFQANVQQNLWSLGLPSAADVLGTSS